MTDTTVADGGGAPAPANEVVIDPNPVNLPNPVGSQAPDKPVESRNESRRDSISKAFERASNPPPKPERHAEKPAPKAAEAKPGHNNPPEPTEGLDLKKRPADQPRGDRGQFAPREQQPQQAQPAAQQQRQPHPQLPEGTPYREPPQRMAEHAKRDWAAAPESVRGEVHRMQQEFQGAYQRFKGDHDEMNTIRPFHDMARQHGTTLQRALSNYVSMEQKLRADPIGGLDVIINNLGIQVPDGQGGMRRANLRDVAYSVLSQSPDQLKAIQTQNAQGAQSHQIGALHQQVAGLQNALHQMHNAQRFHYTRSAVDQFADTHPRFDELGDLIENELKLGFDLETAYRRAQLLRPGNPAAQTRAPSAQTRPADKSIYGSPDVSPSNGASRPQKKVGRREAIEHAINTVNGRL